MDFVWALNLMGGIFVRRGEDTEIHTKRSQAQTETTLDLLLQAKDSPRAIRGRMALLAIDLRLLASRTVRE